MDWKADQSGHWHECICGDKSEISVHTEDNGSVTKPATETETGMKTYYCSVCGYVMRTEIIEKFIPSSAPSPVPSHTESSPLEDKKSDYNPSEENNTNEQPGDSSQETDSTEETMSESSKPFIRNKSGKEGWKAIKEEIDKEEDGNTVIVDMNSSVDVPGDVIENIRGKDITIVFDMGNGITWSTNGKNISKDTISDTNFFVQTNTKNIPEDIVKRVAEEGYSIQISLAHKGEFGFTAMLSLSLGKRNAGLNANLYYYNEDTEELEFICASTVTEEGMASFAFTHASDYVVVADKKEDEQKEESSITKPAQQEETNETAEDNTTPKESTKTGKMWWVIVIGILAIVMGIGIFFAVKKKKETD